MTKESRLKVSLAGMGRKHSAETRRKMSESAKKLFTPERRKIWGDRLRGNTFWIGKKHTQETKEKMRKNQLGKNNSFFGKKHTGEIREKWCKDRSGTGNVNWQGGKSLEGYSTDWTTTLRRSIRERDFYTCQICKEPQGDIAHDVHHIDYNKKNCNPSNLITLCHGCHLKTNYNRNDWLNYFGTRIN